MSVSLDVVLLKVFPAKHFLFVRFERRASVAPSVPQMTAIESSRKVIINQLILYLQATGFPRPIEQYIDMDGHQVAELEGLGGSRIGPRDMGSTSAKQTYWIATRNRPGYFR